MAGRNTQAEKGEGCQRQGGPLALNGSLVRKVEGEEAQIKDVPSLKRKSSHPSMLNGCLEGRAVFVLERVKELPPSSRPADRRGAGIPVFSGLPKPQNATCRLSVHHMLDEQRQGAHCTLTFTNS